MLVILEPYSPKSEAQPTPKWTGVLCLSTHHDDGVYLALLADCRPPRTWQRRGFRGSWVWFEAFWFRGVAGFWPGFPGFRVPVLGSMRGWPEAVAGLRCAKCAF